MKKIINLVLSLTMIFTLFSTNIFNVNAKSINNLEDYTFVELDDGTIEISGYKGSDTDVTIPSMIDEKNVSSIGNEAFSNCSSLTGITIPESVTSIGTRAFSGCSNLVSISIPNSVTRIKDYAFTGCSNLTSIALPNSVISIGEGIFCECSNLKSITIPKGISSIGYSAFYSCSKLTSITIPNSVTSIDSWAFYDCSSLTSIVIPERVTSIGVGAFEGCSSLTSIAIPNSVTSMGDLVFSNCSSLTSITIPKSVTSIGEQAFVACSKLTLSVYSDSYGLEYVKNNNLPYVTISATIQITEVKLNKSTLSIMKDSSETIEATILPDNATDQTLTWSSSNEEVAVVSSNGTVTGLKPGISTVTVTTSNGNTATCEVTVEEPMFKYSELKDGTLSIDGYYGTAKEITIPKSINEKSVTSIGDSAFSDCSSLTSITIPKGVTTIGDRVFFNCISLTSITIPNSVTSIGNYVFSNCIGLTSVSLPESVTSIGNSAFSSCKKITSITIPKGVTIIKDSVFKDCSSLTNITISESLKSIGGSAFSGCSNLKSITIPESVTSIGSYAFYQCSSLTSIVIPKNVTSIEEWVFSSCSSLKNITIPNSVTTIGSYAFSYCSSLKSVTIPEGVKNIEDSVFSGCSDLAGIIIPDSVTSIGDRAFSNCSSLLSITLPKSVTSIGESVFYDCSSLTSITIPEGLTSIGRHAFYDCSNLISITIPESVTSIKEYTFFGCKSLTNIIIPESVTRIESDAFSGCTSLTSIILPELLTDIGGGAFSDCSNLKSITIPALVKSIDDYTFSGCTNLTSITLPEFVTYVGSYAFENCSSLINITIPESVTNIGERAFYNCISLTNITIPKNVPSIGCEVFYNCDSLTNVVISEGVKSIRDGTFAGCESLTSIIIPKSVTDIGDNAFGLVPMMPPLTQIYLNVYADSYGFEYVKSNGFPYKVIGDKIQVTGVKLNKSSLSMIKGNTERIEATISPNNATDQKLIWSSSNDEVATVVNGEITAVAVGTAKITVTTNDENKTETCIVTVTNPVASVSLDKTSLTLEKGNTEIIMATVNPCDATDQTLIWSSSDEDVAAVSADGTVTGIKSGTSTITVKTSNGKTATCEVIVKSVTLDIADKTINKGSSFTLKASINPYDTTDSETFTWSSSDENVAVVSSKGTVTGIKPGISIITVTTSNGMTATCEVIVESPITSVTLNKTSATINKGSSLTLNVTINPSDTTDSETLLWDSSNEDVVEVLSDGTVIGIKPGISTVTVTTSNGKTATCEVTVKSPLIAVTLDTTSKIINKGSSFTLTATINPSDTTDSKALTWSSSNMNVVTVDNTGKVTAIGVGIATITVKTSNGKTATCEVTVKSPINGVTLDTTSKTINKGNSFILKATINPSDTIDSKVLSWSSNNTSIAIVDNTGKVTAIGVGVATITVKTSNGKTATCEVTVKSPITGIILNLTNKTVNIGDSFTLNATINPSDTTDSKTLTWSSSDSSVATVDNTGKVLAKKDGTATITVTTTNGKTATCKVTVKHVHSWDNGTITKKPTCEDTGLKVYKCTICKETKDEIIPALGHKWNNEYTVDKQATIENDGQKSIHCSVCNAIKKDSIVVIPKIVDISITSVKLNKSSVTVKKGKTYILTATISPSDTTDSKSLKWSSSNSKIASVNSEGKVTAKNYGQATITVKTSNGKTAKCIITVPYRSISYKLNGGKNNKSNPSSYYGKKIKLKNPSKKGYTFSGWYSDKKYKKKVTTLSGNSTKTQTLYAKWTKVKVSKAKTPKLTNVKGKKLKITYSATSGAKGYQIQYSTSKKFTKATTKTIKGKSATYKLAKKTYYVRVRAYKTDSTGAKVYGSWSAVKSIKIKK